MGETFFHSEKKFKQPGQEREKSQVIKRRNHSAITFRENNLEVYRLSAQAD